MKTKKSLHKTVKPEEQNNPKSPRKNWDVQFKRMHKNGDDKLLIPDFFHDELVMLSKA
ncbi:MAG: hypothetical protein H7321_07830 [Bacteroidia bacterium]|nr:hypothetical protein [Bacteroidia bacterium]